jgi:hypothetical protein
MSGFLVWLKQAKWVLFALVAAGFAVLVWCLRGMFDDNSNHPKPEDGGYLPPAPKPLQEAADKAAEDAMVAKAGAKAATAVKKQELETITKISDGKARRKALAAFLKTV